MIEFRCSGSDDRLQRPNRVFLFRRPEPVFDGPEIDRMPLRRSRSKVRWDSEIAEVFEVVPRLLIDFLAGYVSLLVVRQHFL